ncbi:hypothetical protein ACWCPM_06750 [Streptomyces sp. NPDC002309]
MSLRLRHRTPLTRTSAVRIGSVIAACGAAGLLATAASTVAHAEPAGTLDVDPGTGADDELIMLTSSAACPETATHLIVSVQGSGFPAEGQFLVGNSPIETYVTTEDGGIRVPLTYTMRDYANTAGFTTLQGRYDFTLTCRTAFNPASLADFTAPIWFTSNTTYQDTDPSGGTPSPSTTASPTTSATPTGTPTETGTPTPTDTGTPTDTATPTDTGAPTDSATPTETSGTSGSGGSQNVSTEVSGGGSGGNGSLAATGSNAVLLGAVSFAMVAGGALVVRRARRRETFPATDTSAH